MLSRGIAIAGIGLASIDYVADTSTLDESTAALFDLPANVPLPRAQVHARFHADDIAQIENAIAAVLDLAGNGFMSIEHRIVRSDGSICWVSARKQIEFAFTATGERRPVSAVLAVLDITEHQLTVEALRQNQALFTTLIDQAPAGVYIVDADFRMHQVNALAAPVFRSIHPLIGRDFNEVMAVLWGPQLGAEISEIFRRTLSSGIPYVSSHFAAQRADKGVEESYEWETKRVRLADGKFGVACYFRDVTARQHEDQIRADREAHVRSILDNTSTFIGLLNIDGTLLEANAPALTAGGETREAVVGKKLWDTNWFRHDAAEAERLKQAIAKAANGETVRYDTSVRMAGDTRMEIDFMLAPVRDAAGNVTLLVPSGQDITSRKRDLDHIQMLMAEVNHRAKNLLGVVQAIARQTAKHSDPAVFAARLSDRIAGLAACHDLLVRNQWQGVDIHDLASAQLAHFRDLVGSRVVLSGPPIRISPGAAQGIGMALHELSTNATKYGALSNQNGRVELTWSLAASKTPHFSMTWTESGGPKITPPKHAGFGHLVIGRMAEAALQGSADLQYRETGLIWTLSAPLSNMVDQVNFLDARSS